VVLAARGARKMNGEEEMLPDSGQAERLRSRARRIYVESALAAVALTLVSFLFASVLPETVRSYHSSSQETVEFLIGHGYSLLFGWVLAEQLGLPIPAIPLLLSAGALAGSGKLDLPAAASAALIAVILADLFWYFLGRYRGGFILKLLCRISLEPDSCVRRTENLFTRYGARSLLVAKFVPGLNTAAPAMAGMFRLPLRRFIVFDFFGGFSWVAAFTGLGFAFSDQLEQIAAESLRLGGWLVVIVGGSLAVYILWKYIQRRRFLHRLRIARITPRELMDKLTAGEDIFIVDLRQPIDIAAFPRTIPGALRIAMEQIEERHAEIPRDRDIVLYCS
jgi:membrane protein DedA with SNARE-associated domain